MQEPVNNTRMENLPVERADQNSLAADNREQQKYLTFVLDEDAFGVEIQRVKEIIEYGQITRVPMTHQTIRGVLNLRGNVLPVIDLSVRLGREKTQDSKRACVIIVEFMRDDERVDIGFIVDAVDQVVDIHEDNIEQAPSFGADIRVDFINGMGKIKNDFVVLLDLDRVLDIDELAQLSSVV